MAERPVEAPQPTVDAVSDADRFEEHQRAGALDDVHVRLAAQLDGLIRQGARAADSLEEPDVVDLQGEALADDRRPRRPA